MAGVLDSGSGVEVLALSASAQVTAFHLRSEAFAVVFQALCLLAVTPASVDSRARTSDDLGRKGGRVPLELLGIELVPNIGVLDSVVALGAGAAVRTEAVCTEALAVELQTLAFFTGATGGTGRATELGKN